MTYLILIIAAAIAWVFGMVWYHPKILGSVRSKGLPEELCGPPGAVGFALSYLQMLLIGVAALATSSLTAEPMAFWQVMGAVALSYFVGISAGGHMAGTGKNTYLVDAGYVTVSVLIISAIVFYI